MKSALAQAYLLITTTGLVASIVNAMKCLAENDGATAVLSLGVGALFYVLIPTLNEPEESL